jgi:hypothetical protein
MKKSRQPAPIKTARPPVPLIEKGALVWQRVRACPAWAVVLGVSVAWHLFVMSHATPNLFPDSGSYTSLAEAMRDGQWQPGFTFRPPGYPAFLFVIFRLFGWKNFQAVMVAQVALGVTIPLLLYALFALISGRRWIAAAGALGFLLDRYSLGLETVPLSEFLSGYTALAGLVAFVYGIRSRRLWTAGGAGLVAAINFLIRPSFQYAYWFWVLAAVILCWKWAKERQWQRGLLLWLGLFLVVIHLFIAAWSYAVWRHTGVFAPSLQLGASMTNHTGSMMELAPDKYATIRDMFVAEREKRGGDYINLFDQAGWKIAEATSCTLWQLSLKFREINAYLIWHHPARYLAQVREAWDRIWTDDSLYVTDLTDPYATGRPIELTVLARFIRHNALTRSLYAPIESNVWGNPPFLRLVPWLLLALGAACYYFVRTSPFGSLTTVTIVGTIFYHMLVHAMVQFTEFGRYKLPVQGLWFSFLIFSAVFVADEAWRLFSARQIASRQQQRRRRR